jgi:hypoxanthine phosphoribosyltransferase
MHSKVDYVGMTCPDEFVVGYGMDYASQFRSLPVVAVLKRSVYE